MTLSQVIEEALHVTFSLGKNPVEQSPRQLPISKHRSGTRPGVDINDGARLRDLMDGYE